jgi:IMP dehydrogenase
VDKKGTLQGLITIKDINKRIKYPNACKDPRGRLRVGAAVGVTEETDERAEALVMAGVDVIVVDTAHGHSAGVLKTVRALRKKYPKLSLIAGNVVTGDAVRALADAGVDTVKVGVGPGSICTTRVVTGVGVPQIWAIAECSKAGQKAKVGIIADGGIKYSGDLTKAIAAGADAVMLGGLFAGTEESPGEVINLQGRMFKVYNGMGSLAAMQKGKSADRYFQDGVTDAKKLVPEGIEARVPYRGQLSELVYQLVGGLRAGMGYSGTKTLKDLKENGKFVQITSAGYQESHPHDVVITKEAPNYYLDS